MTLGFSPQRCLASLLQLGEAEGYWVAYSGGLDSHVLLHALASLGASPAGRALGAVHVNHGLNPQADAWERHCERVCRALGVPFRAVGVDARALAGEGPEAAARAARYRALEALAESGHMVLTAHHRDDQAETLLLHLLRGSGPHGLAAMPRLRRLGDAWLGRPLLGFSRAELHAYARARGLRWVDDPSNQDAHYPRNFLRHEVIPLLNARQPGVAAALSRAAAHQAEAAGLLDEVAAADSAAAAGPRPGTLRVEALRSLSAPRRRNVLRYWLQGLGLPLPGARHVAHLLRDVLEAAWDAKPLVRWRGAEVRRYRDLVYAMRPMTPHDPNRRLAWSLERPLALGHGTLRLRRADGAGLRRPAADVAIEVRFRRGGERCMLPGRRHSQALKKLFQEAGVPPWARERTPLLYVGGELAAVAGLWVCAPFHAGPGEAGWELEWVERQ